MKLDLRDVTIANPFDPTEEPSSASFHLARLLALSPEALYHDPVGLVASSLALHRDGVVELSDELALFVEGVIRSTSRLSNLVKAVLLREWFKQKMEQTHG